MTVRNAIVFVCLAAVVVLPYRDSAAFAANPFADEIVIRKSARTLSLRSHGEALAIFTISLGSKPVGKKERQGDGKTPEGKYVVDKKNSRSQFYKSLHISYPNEQDIKDAHARGVSPGGDIMIHGIKNGMGWLGAAHRLFDWTQGCIAVTNEEMDRIWQVVPVGTPVTIEP